MHLSRKSHLGTEIFNSLRSAPFREFICDYGLTKKKKFSRGLTLSLALLFTDELRRRTPKEKRIGVVLPASFAGILANISIFLSGRIPVNLNFTLGSDINEEIIQRANIKTIITASRMVEKFSSFPWGLNRILIDDSLREISARTPKILVTYLMILIRPQWVWAKHKVALQGGEETAVLLFTSGSSGNPKGVPLSHSNILANCRQILALDLFKPKHKVLLNLPLFHSFGLSIGMLFSTLRGMTLVCTPSPLDSKLSIKAIKGEGVDIILGTPTFLRGYLKYANQDELSSIQYVVAGAERSPRHLIEKWETEVGCEYLEGYGLTETSPAISFNLVGSHKKYGSVGRILAGIECRTIDPHTGKKTSLDTGGILCFKGPNIFSGYWNDPDRSMGVLSSDGWFRTGDLGRVDRDGFLWIEGRESRFSKIGGEMVPHGRIEEELMDVLNLQVGDEPQLVVVATLDEQKGEKLLVLSSLDLTIEQIKSGLQKKGIPNLWIPRECIKVKSIPLLGTGKVDWRSIKSMVLNRTSNY